jgi:hypothetical protein
MLPSKRSNEGKKIRDYRTMILLFAFIISVSAHLLKNERRDIARNRKVDQYVFCKKLTFIFLIFKDHQAK